MSDEARVMVSVAVPIHRAFAIFTEEIDRWWRRGLKYRHFGGEEALVRIEPGVGGRVYERAGPGAGDGQVEIGRVLAWDPPRRLAFTWRNAAFAPREETRVEVDFLAHDDGTQVTVTHRGWSAIRDDHPARHGLLGGAFVRGLGLWWGDQLSSLRELAEW